MTDSTPARFALDEDKARSLIARALRRYQSGEDGPAPDYETLSLAPKWDPMSYDEEPAVADLVYAARTCGAIAQPEGTEIDLDYMPDSDGGMYQWTLYVKDHYGLRFTSPPEEYRRLGWRGAKGTAGQAMEILREAVERGNSVLGSLDRYVAASEPYRRGASDACDALGEYGSAKFGDEWWPGNAQEWVGPEAVARLRAVGIDIPEPATA